MSLWVIIFWLVIIKVIFCAAVAVYYSIWDKKLNIQEEIIKKDHLVRLCTKTK